MTSKAAKNVIILDNIVIVENFGAIGDGVTDDTAAFASAITEAMSSKRKLILKSPIYKANIAITGTGLVMEAESYSFYKSAGTASPTVGIIAAVTTDPVLQIGDGTTTTQDIYCNGIELAGKNASDKGLLIYGADRVELNAFAAGGFAVYQVRLDSSATKSTSRVFVNDYNIQCGTTAGSLGLDFNFGSTYTTAVFFRGGSFSEATGGSYIIKLTGASSLLHLSDSWLTAGNNTGINFASTSTQIRCANVVLDSDSSSDILVTLPENAAIGAYLKGTISVDGVVSMTGGSTAAISGISLWAPNLSVLVNPVIDGSVFFAPTSGNEWDRYTTPASIAQKIYRTSTNFFVQNQSGAIQIVTGTTSKLAVTSRGIDLIEANGQTTTVSHAATTVSPSGATATFTSLIPANSLVIGVTIRVTTIVGGTLTSFDIGDGSDVDKWGATIALALDTTTNIANFTTTNPTYYAAATNVVLTANGGTFSSGVVRATVHYMTLVAATS